MSRKTPTAMFEKFRSQVKRCTIVFNIAQKLGTDITVNTLNESQKRIQTQVDSVT